MNAFFRSRGFTLVEMLVAVAVLSLLVLILSQVVELTGQAISLNAKNLDSSGQARLFFDRLGFDFAARPSRSDLGMVCTNVSGNDSLQFYSQVEGYSGARKVCVVGYRIQQSTAGRIYQLERGATGTDWTAGTTNPLIQFLPQLLAAPADADYEVLANDIFRLEFCYLLKTGVLSDSHSVAATNYNDVSALVVAVGVLDSDSRKLLSDDQLETLANDLPDTTEGHDPIYGWNTSLNQTGFGAGLPPSAVKNIHVYQRTFCVP